MITVDASVYYNIAKEGDIQHVTILDDAVETLYPKVFDSFSDFLNTPLPTETRIGMLENIQEICMPLSRENGKKHELEHVNRVFPQLIAKYM